MQGKQQLEATRTRLCSHPPSAFSVQIKQLLSTEQVMILPDFTLQSRSVTLPLWAARVPDFCHGCCKSDALKMCTASPSAQRAIRS